MEVSKIATPKFSGGGGSDGDGDTQQSQRSSWSLKKYIHVYIYDDDYREAVAIAGKATMARRFVVVNITSVMIQLAAQLEGRAGECCQRVAVHCEACGVLFENLNDLQTSDGALGKHAWQKGRAQQWPLSLSPIQSPLSPVIAQGKEFV